MTTHKILQTLTNLARQDGFGDGTDQTMLGARVITLAVTRLIQGDEGLATEQGDQLAR